MPARRGGSHRRRGVGAPRELRPAARRRRRRGVLPAPLRAAGGAAALWSGWGSRRRATSRPQARDARYALAAAATPGDFAAAHTASDQAETVLYRLAVSPGSRALRGMDARRGRLVRPLLEVTREEVREYLRAAGSQWREDPSNEDPRFARARVRHEVIPALKRLNPTAERTIAETARQLREEAEVLELAAADGAHGAGRRPGRAARGARAAARGAAPAGASPARRGRRRPAARAVAQGGGRRARHWGATARSRSTSAAASGRWPSTAR